jgi:pimeloyl-ACP methyl ester carboxylesterase
VAYLGRDSGAARRSEVAGVLLAVGFRGPPEFLRTLRSVVDYRSQAVSALNQLQLTADLPTLLIWGDRDRIIPV